MSMLSEHAAEVFGELDVYLVRAGVAIDPRAIAALDELRQIFAEGEAEKNRLTEMLEDTQGVEWRMGEEF
jgi:hypothetical protein